jgi:hypothetical protein
LIRGVKTPIVFIRPRAVEVGLKSDQTLPERRDIIDNEFDFDFFVTHL